MIEISIEPMYCKDIKEKSYLLNISEIQEREV